MKSRVHSRLPVGLALLAAGCATTEVQTADTSDYEARGVFVRHVRVQISPSHTEAFESLLEYCVQVAQDADLARGYEWLCYREPPGRYWLLWFSDTADGFAFPNSPDPLIGFVHELASLGSGDLLGPLDRQLSALHYEIEWDTLHRQKAAWSTVESMSTSTDPIARMMVRSVRPGAEAAFDRALSDRTSFLGQHGYPRPIEGFVTLIGAPGTALQVVFGRDWATFLTEGSPEAFAETLEPAPRDIFAARSQILSKTIEELEYYDGSHAAELSFGSY